MRMHLFGGPTGHHVPTEWSNNFGRVKVGEAAYYKKWTRS